MKAPDVPSITWRVTAQTSDEVLLTLLELAWMYEDLCQ